MFVAKYSLSQIKLLALSPKFAQNQLGHAKNATTMDWYAKNSQDMIDIAQETFNQIFSSGEKMVKKNEVETENKIISMADVI